MNDIQRINCFNTDVTILSIPVKGTSQTLAAYFRGNKYAVCIVTVEESQWQYKSLDGQPFILANIEDEKFYIEASKNMVIEKFSNEMRQVQTTSLKAPISLKSTSSEGTGYSCCRKAPSYDECINCTVSGLNGVTFAYLATYNPAILLAIAASCVGAGPDAWC